MPEDRKALIRRYKETPRPAGVGVIRNTANGKSLVVAGRDVPSLLNRHLAQLRVGMHPVKALQADWGELGREAFTFDVVDTLKPPEDPAWDPREELEVLEAMWMEKLAPYEPQGYHRRPVAKG
jgi:hypothetical protein